MKKFLMWAIPAGLVLAGGAVTYALAFAGGDERPDCPGKIRCPLTGEPICRDLCPLGAVGGEARPAPR